MAYLVTILYKGKQMWLCIQNGGHVMWTSEKSQATECTIEAAKLYAQQWGGQWTESDK